MTSQDNETQSQTIGLLGGSFDPPHVGHVLLAAWSLISVGLDEVWLVPCRQHAFGKPLTPFEHRVMMCRLAVAPLGHRVSVEAIEGEIGDPNVPSYTVDTVRALVERHPEVRFRLLMGSDLAGEFNQWRESEALRALAPPLIVPRMGHDQAGEVHLPEALPALSSSAVRERIGAGEPLEGWLPQAVIEYIRAKGLYARATA